MKLPPDVTHQRLISLLERHGYRVVRQRGSHMRLKHPGPPEHHLTIPKHRIVRTGTLHTILNLAAVHLKVSLKELLEQI